MDPWQCFKTCQWSSIFPSCVFNFALVLRLGPNHSLPPRTNCLTSPSRKSTINWRISSFFDVWKHLVRPSNPENLTESMLSAHIRSLIRSFKACLTLPTKLVVFWLRKCMCNTCRCGSHWITDNMM